MTREEFAERAEGMIPALFRVCYSLLPAPEDREDAVQGALLSAYESLAKLREERYFQTWVIRILINECRAIARGRARSSPSDAPERWAASESTDPALRDALLALPARLRLPIVMHYMSGYTVREIAEALRVPEGTVKARMRRARRLLRIELTEG